jgi:hypothetical protein
MQETFFSNVLLFDVSHRPPSFVLKLIRCRYKPMLQSLSQCGAKLVINCVSLKFIIQ